VKELIAVAVGAIIMMNALVAGYVLMHIRNGSEKKS
jgi:hypothetical protein